MALAERAFAFAWKLSSVGRVIRRPTMGQGARRKPRCMLLNRRTGKRPALLRPEFSKTIPLLEGHSGHTSCSLWRTPLHTTWNSVSFLHGTALFHSKPPLDHHFSSPKKKKKKKGLGGKRVHYFPHLSTSSTFKMFAISIINVENRL